MVGKSFFLYNEPMRSKTRLSKALIDLAISILVAVVLTMIASSSLSPVYGPYEGSNFTYDGALFQYEALSILKGNKPYLDIYDHKGLFHLGINILGVLINKDYGLIVLEIVSQTISIFFFVKTIKQISPSKRIKAITILFFMFVRLLAGAGNTIGIWLTPFIALYYFFFVKGLKNGENIWFYFGSILLGITAGLALNSRALDMVYVWGGVIFLFVLSIKEKTWKEFFKNIGIVATSFILVCSIFAIITATNGYLKEMLEATIIDNFIYVGRQNGALLDEIFMKIICVLLLTLFSIVFFAYKNKVSDKKMNLFVFISGVSAFLPLIVLIKFFSHFLASIPLMGLSIAYFIDAFPKENKVLKNTFLGVFSSLSVVLLLTPLVYYTVGLGDFSSKKNDLDVIALNNAIPESERNDNEIYVIDASCAVYLYLDVVTDCKYYCNQTWWSYDNENVFDISMDYVKSHTPKYLVVWKESEPKLDASIKALYTKINDEAARFVIYRLN